MIKFIKTFFAKASRFNIPVSCSESQLRLIHLIAKKRRIPYHVVLQEVFDNGCRASYNQFLLADPRLFDALPSYEDLKKNHTPTKQDFHNPSSGL